MTSTLVPHFLAALSRRGICQAEVARLLGCSASQASRLASGERTLPLEDLRGLLQRLCRSHPEMREELVVAAIGPLLEGTGLRLVAGELPPPSAPAGRVIDLEEWRMRRAA